MFDTLLTMEASGGSSGWCGSRSSSRTKWHDHRKIVTEGRFDVGIQMQYPVLYEESMNTVRSSASGFTSLGRFFPRIMAVGPRGYWEA